ncbi:cell division protein FtsQ/DivIB [Rhodovulum tesquicola]|uniref:cell division protein FtsQ/DivIB n=1 Tax=Rhodovulum tesquicola TaxID=540254 RepID=UPI00209706F6|nr:cell division protein FtsQ/DivIB [Rhodovulum tesquicola]MCO8144156.1 cell division protein FtsQ/DivIB [Rhodovulum tesquicola]
MCAVILPPRDPAPSRLTYRMQRLWLTPLFRLAVLRGLPLAAVLAIPALWFGDADRRAEVAGQIADIRRQVETRPEFMVKLMAVEGASALIDAEIRETLPLDFPVSSFDLDLQQMRRTVEALDAVETAELRVRPGGVLDLKVVERVPAVVWRGAAGLELLDAQGNRVAPIETRSLRADLPLIAGEGAQRAVPEALALVAAAAPIEERLRGLVRVGERRWDVVLDRNQRILLPGQDAVAALERVIALDGVTDMLGRDIAVVDLRNPGRPTVRLAPDAVEEFRKIRRSGAGATNG